MKVILIIISILSLAFGIIATSLMLRYLYLYRNLHKNFKSFLNFVDTKYISKKDVILYNATVEALQMAKDKNNMFEVKAYSKLLERLKEGE